MITLAVYLYLRRGYWARARAALAARVAAGTVPASEAPAAAAAAGDRLRRARPGADRAEVGARQQADLDGVEDQAADRA